MASMEPCCSVSSITYQNRGRRATEYLKNVRAAAEKHGRVFAVEYDLSGAHPDLVFQQLQSDWEYISDELKLPSSTAYLRLNGKPVVSLWGLGFGDKNHIDDPQLALKIIDWFKRTKHAAVIGRGSCRLGQPFRR